MINDQSLYLNQFVRSLYKSYLQYAGPFNHYLVKYLDFDPKRNTNTYLYSQIGKNLAFVADINTRMKDDMSAARRKLTNSLTSNQFREVNIRTATRNFRPVVSQVQQFGMRQIRHERSQPQLMNQTLIHFTHQNPPGYNPQVPEQAESILSKQSQQVIQFRRESQVVRQNGTQMQSQSESEALMKANFTISQLQEIIKTNDQKARAAILTIQ